MLELDVTGMTCSHCVHAVTQAVKTLDLQADVEVDLAARRVRVQGRSTADELIRVLDAAGYTARSAGG